MPGAKEPFSIYRCDEKGVKIMPEQRFQAMLNPGSYTHTRTPGLSDIKTKKPRAQQPQLQTLSLEDLVFDGTGVVEMATPLSVDAQIRNLAEIVDLAEPVNDKLKRPVVLLAWGSLHFIGRLVSMAVKYTLFRPDGLPLRARVTLQFAEYQPGEAVAAPQVGDYVLVRQVRVKQAATLPLICFEAYQDSALTAVVALANDLTSFRKLRAGQTIKLPPL